MDAVVHRGVPALTSLRPDGTPLVVLTAPLIALLLLAAIHAPGTISVRLQASAPARTRTAPVITPVAKLICKTVSKTVHGNRKNVQTCHIVKPPVLPIISLHLPAYASNNIYTGSSAGYANDDNYSTEYRSSGLPAWVAYDLSSVPAKHRSRVLAVYYNVSYGYDTAHGAHYDNLADYTIQGNAAPGDTDPPTRGWVPLVSMTGNTLHSRQHILHLARYNWMRIEVTRSDGAAYNNDAAFNEFDLYDMSSLPHAFDDWIFFGNSITAKGMTTTPENGVPPFAALIHRADPARRPIAENGGDPFDTSADAVKRLLGRFSARGATGYLSIFPGMYVVLSYGVNDAAIRTDGSAYYRNMRRLVRAVLAAGKVPVIPKIDYTKDAERNANIPRLNARIDRLYDAYPQIVKGPDFWSFFRQHPNLIRPNDIHPTDAGLAAMRQLWAKTMVRTVYGVGVSCKCT